MTERLNHSTWWEGGKERYGTEHHGSESWENHSEDSTIGVSPLGGPHSPRALSFWFRREKPSPENGLLGPGGWRCLKVSLSPSQLSPPVASAFPLPPVTSVPHNEKALGAARLSSSQPQPKRGS